MSADPDRPAADSPAFASAPKTPAEPSPRTPEPGLDTLAPIELADRAPRRDAQPTADRPLAPLRALPAAFAAIASGVLYWAAFPGVDVWPFAFVCWAPLLVAVAGQTPRRALWLGALQGLTCNVLGFYWLFGMLKTFSGFPDALCALFMVILCGYQGGRMALMAWLSARAARKGWPLPTTFTLGLIASEVAYPLLFPWYTGAQTHTAPLLMQLAEVGGPIAIGVALMGGSVLAAELWWSMRERRPLHRPRVLIALAGPIVLVLWGAVRMPMVQRHLDASAKATVALVQGNMPLGGGADALAVHRNETMRAEQQAHPDLVVWSEAALPGAVPETQLGGILRAYVLAGIHTPTVVGLVVARGGDPTKTRLSERGGRYFNSAALVEPDGKVEGVYDKTYLLAFGEYIPFGDWFPQLYEISRNSGRLTKGSSLDALPFGEHRISALICYEDILPYFVNGAVRHGDPDLLVNMTNDAWFGRSTEPAIHLALAKFRAVEHRRYLVRATNTGVSAFVDALGRSSGETALFVQTTTVGEIRWMREHTVYEVLGDAPWWALAVALVAMGLVRRERLFPRSPVDRSNAAPPSV